MKIRRLQHRRWFSAAALSLTAASFASPADASWLDSDYYCRVYGCVVVHDGFTFDVYDNYVFATGGRVPEGGRMIPWTGNPFEGAGGVNPVFTGTRTEGFHNVPLQDESVRLGIDQNRDGIIDLEPTGGSNAGFLDAGDAFNPFAIHASSDLVAADTSAQRSFYLSSRTDFYLSAQVFSLGAGDELNTPAQYRNIDFRYAITRNGNDDGMQFGANARNGNYIRSLNNIDDLGDLYGQPVNIMEFRQNIRQRASASLPSQSIRFDYVYGFQDYDMSMGAGHMRYRIEFDFYNR